MEALVTLVIVQVVIAKNVRKGTFKAVTIKVEEVEASEPTAKEVIAQGMEVALRRAIEEAAKGNM